MRNKSCAKGKTVILKFVLLNRTIDQATRRVLCVNEQYIPDCQVTVVNRSYVGTMTVVHKESHDSSIAFISIDYYLASEVRTSSTIKLIPRPNATKSIPK